MMEQVGQQAIECGGPLIQEDQELQEEELEERTLNVLVDSKVNQDFANSKSRKRGETKHKVRHMKRPMAIPHVIVELQNDQSRESALRCLSTYLLEKREDDPYNYDRTGCLLYDSCCTMAILLQELITFFKMMIDQTLTIRASKRLDNVLTLFQCIAANKESRQKFLKSLIPSLMVPLVLFKTPLKIYENVRAVALSVIGILCQTREPRIIQWAVESNVIEACQVSMEIGNELSSVIAMHILEAILQDDMGISYICSSVHDHVLEGLMKAWENLVTILVMNQDLSPRLLFHIIRCYVLLCNHVTGFSVLVDSLPDPITNGSFNAIAEEFPAVGTLLHQLLITLGNVEDFLVAALPQDLLL